MGHLPHLPGSLSPADLWPRTAVLRAVRYFTPYQQGALDFSCSVYAIINALRLASYPRQPLYRSQCEQLFAAALDILDARLGLAQVLTNGLAVRSWIALTRALCRHAIAEFGITITVDQPFEHSAAHSIAEVFAVVEAAIAAQSPTMLLLEGAYDHFTVISGHGARTLQLFDSYGYKRIARQSCGLSVPRRRSEPSRHLISPRSVLIVRPAGA